MPDYKVFVLPTNGQPTTVSASESAAPGSIPVAGDSGVLSSAYIPVGAGGSASIVPFFGGNGRYGTITLAAGGGSILSGVIAWDSGTSEYYLISDLQANNLTINASVTLRVDGWRVFVLNLLTMGNNALIHANGASASGFSAGLGAAPRNATSAAMAGGYSGVNGLNYTTTTTGNGTAATSTVIAGTVRRGGTGVSGANASGPSASGPGGTSTGGAGGTGTPWSDSTHGLPNAVLGPQAVSANSLKMAGGCAGGSGGARNTAGTTSQSGASGGGGGVVSFAAFRAVLGTGVKIQANGGNGGNAVCIGTQNGMAGGGSGASGGAIIGVIVQIESGSLTCEAKGGAGGNGAALPATGGAADVFGNGGNGGYGGYVEVYVGTGGVSIDVSGGAGGIGAVVGVGPAVNGTNGNAGTAIAAPGA